MELVWSSFDYWLRHYGALTARYVADERAKDDAVWRSFVRLRDNAAERDGRETAENERLSKAEIDEFLKYEEGQEKGEVRDADLN